MYGDTDVDTKTGLFLKGKKGGPGRPKGARAKLGEAFLEDMRAAWEMQGKKVIDRVIADRPQDFMKVIASLLPRDVNLTVNNMDDATDDELLQRIRDIDAAIRPFLDATGEVGIGEGNGSPRPN
jgi:hypothetical protein